MGFVPCLSKGQALLDCLDRGTACCSHLLGCSVPFAFKNGKKIQVCTAQATE